MAPTNEQFHVLFIEDDEVDIQSVQREIKKLEIPIELYIAKDGVEALNKLYGKNGEPKLPKPHLILLDINMPKMSGIQFLQILQKDVDLKHVIVYFLTTAYTTRDKIASQGLCVAGHIIKPLQQDDLMRIYWSLIEGTPS